MKIKITRGYEQTSAQPDAVWAGREVDVPEEEAKRLIAHGRAEAVVAKKAAKKK